jgi:capsular polysaccharide biosynthesis protein
MDYEVDLTPYIRAVMKNWVWIVGAGILFAVAGFIYATIQPETYQATAFVTLSRDRLDFNFDERADTVPDNVTVSTGYTTLALSDGVMQTVAQAVGQDFEAVKSSLQADLSPDRTVLQLTAVSHQPDQAAQLANSWATTFVSQMGQAFGFQGAEQAQYFSNQLAHSTQVLAEAEANLIAANGGDTAAILGNQLQTLTQTHAANLTRQNEVAQLLQEVTSWQSQAENINANTLALLQVQTLSLNENAGIQLQLDTTNNFTLSTPQKQAQLETLVQVLGNYAHQLSEFQLTLEAEIQLVQQTFETARLTKRDAERDFLLAEETYLTLSRKSQEAALTQADVLNPIRIASPAITPTRPEGKGRTTTSILLGAVGAFLALVVVLLTPVWRSIREVT